MKTPPAPKPKVRPLSPCQAERELAALLRLYNEADPDEISDADYERMRGEILARLRQ